MSTQLGLLSSDGTSPAERGRIHVHQGDWREQKLDWPRPFVLVSDPPYGIAYRSQFTRTGRRGIAGTIANDEDTKHRDAMLTTDGWVAAAVFGPGSLNLLRVPPWGEPDGLLTWDKGDCVGLGDLAFPWGGNWETVAIYGKAWKGKRTSGSLRYTPVMGGQLVHTHQKPVPLLADIIRKAPPGLPIVDPFMGSGTTAVACALLGREFYGAEIDPQYWPVIRGRLAAVGVAIGE